MPYKYPEEILEISEEKNEDPTLLQATDIPGSPDTDEEGNVTHKYAPFVVADKTYVRKPDSTLDWQSYRFEMVMGDGTRNDFVFSAKDDGDAQRKVRERIAATSRDAGATFKLARLAAPHEVDLGELSGEETVDETDPKKGAKAGAKAAKADKAEAKSGAKRGRPSKADTAKRAEAQAADKRAEAGAADANAEKGDENEA